jgi:hypothetical protein
MIDLMYEYCKINNNVLIYSRIKLKIGVKKWVEKGHVDYTAQK